MGKRQGSPRQAAEDYHLKSIVCQSVKGTSQTVPLGSAETSSLSKETGAHRQWPLKRSDWLWTIALPLSLASGALDAGSGLGLWAEPCYRELWALSWPLASLQLVAARTFASTGRSL